MSPQRRDNPRRRDGDSTDGAGAAGSRSIVAFPHSRQTHSGTGSTDFLLPPSAATTEGIRRHSTEPQRRPPHSSPSAS
ncbi:MAG: hypothetical protein ACR2OE_16355, partial [Thermomicrobiales bacterium]